MLRCVGDESTILPRRSIRLLKSAWNITATVTQQQGADSARNALYSESFLRMFVDMCGHYQQHIQPDQSGKNYFEVCQLPLHKITHDLSLSNFLK